MSVYIDFITVVWAVGILFVYSNLALTKRDIVSVVGFLCTGTYLVAQSGWTTAFFLGDVWGRDFSNYIWFIFNTLVFLLLTKIWFEKKK